MQSTPGPVTAPGSVAESTLLDRDVLIIIIVVGAVCTLAVIFFIVAVCVACRRRYVRRLVRSSESGRQAWSMSYLHCVTFI